MLEVEVTGPEGLPGLGFGRVIAVAELTWAHVQKVNTRPSTRACCIPKVSRYERLAFDSDWKVETSPGPGVWLQGVSARHAQLS